jgi:hypothetical protein
MTTLRSPNRKALLAIDGGGIRGLLSLQILKKIEAIAGECSGDPDIRLSACFDYISGTSTGAIIAAALSLGMRVADVEQFYLSQAQQMFSLNRNILKRYTSARYDSSKLQEQLQNVFGHDTTLGSSRLQSLLMLVLMNASTASPWPLSSNPQATYNRLDNCGTKSNLHLPLWQLVRASAAAPFYFAPEAITIEGQQFLFFDGALTSYNNPAFKLFQMATLPQYQLHWPTGPDRLLLVSVGTGLVSHSLAKQLPETVNFLDSIPGALQSVMFAGTVEQDLACRSLGEVRAGDPIDGEVGNLVGVKGIGTPLYSYMRYNADLSSKALTATGFARYESASLAMDSLAAIEPCVEIGRWVAQQKVRSDHFRGFWN